VQTCPSEETNAAFLDGRLDEEARRQVVEHLADCGECRDMAVAVDEFRNSAARQGPETNMLRTRRLRLFFPFGTAFSLRELVADGYSAELSSSSHEAQRTEAILCNVGFALACFVAAGLIARRPVRR
jgi:hypothetical protein